MSSYFDEASLVMIPSGYKDQKVYSVKPLDGSGDLTFSRASSATRVASNGLIEKVRTNIFLYSNTFSDAAWTKNNTTLTSGQADPFGGNNAWKFQSILPVQSDLRQTVAGAAGYSVYAKAGSYGFISLWTGTIGISFDLTNGTAGAGGKITSVGGGWYRCSVATSSTGSVTLIPYFSATAGDFVYIAFAQAEPTDVPTDYIATTSAAVSVGPVSGLPRLDYLNSSCPRLILEPQRTSNVQFSESFDNAYWAKTNVTLTSTLGGPIDQSKYFTITCDGATGRFKGVGKTFINASANTYTLSVFAKAGTSSSFVVSSRATLTTDDTRAIFNLSNGTITNTNGGTATIVPYGDGWYRCSFTVVNAGTFTNESSIFFGHPFGAANGATVLATGAMSEVGAYATSYIPTLGTSVTRVADAASKTGISSLIGQTEGTIFIDVENNESETSCIISTNAGAGANSHIYIGQSGNNLALYVRSGGTYSIIASSIANVIGRKKIALAYGASFARIYMNGTQVYNSTAAVIPSGLDRIEMNVFNTSSDIGNVKFNQALYFTTKLTDTQLAELTTL